MSKQQNLPDDVLPLQTKFTLGPEITEEQQRFLDTHGFLHFKNVVSPDEVQTILQAAQRVEDAWIAEKRKSVFGVPLFYGERADGSEALTRLCFTSVFAPEIGEILRDGRFAPLLPLVGPDARVGEREKDGVVINRYVRETSTSRPRLGWHTDGLRDIFYLRMPQQMLNFGVHLTSTPKEKGGLRLIPGSHTQGFFDTCFRYPYFVSHKEDPEEVCVETEAGDLTVHDGRLWHRVAQSEITGPESERRTLFVPLLSGPYEPKDDSSKTPPYHHLGRLLRKVQAVTGKIGIF